MQKPTGLLIWLGCFLLPITVLAQNDPADYAKRAVTKLIDDNYDGAIVDFDKASQWAPSSIEPQILLWLVLARRGQTAAANQELSSYLDRDEYQLAKAELKALGSN